MIEMKKCYSTYLGIELSNNVDAILGRYLPTGCKVRG
jgi:hypothetical protein